MKRIEGRCFTAGAPSAPFSCTSTLDGPGVDAGVGPALLRTVSCGAAVSARFLVMLAGDAGGGSLDEGWGWVSVSVSVCLREGGRGRVAALWEAVAREGEAGGVCVDARGRVLDGLESSRGSSEAPLECRCRFLRKLKPRRPEGRGIGEFVDTTVEATVGAVGAGAVYITAAATMSMYCPGPEASYPSGCVNRVSTTFDRQHGTDALFTRPYVLRYGDG